MKRFLKTYRIRRKNCDSICEAIEAGFYMVWVSAPTAERNMLWFNLSLAFGGTKPGFLWRISRVFS